MTPNGGQLMAPAKALENAIDNDHAQFHPLAGLAAAGVEWDALWLFAQCARRARPDFTLAAVQEQVRRLAVFRGGFSGAAAMAVTTLFDLAGLVEKALLQVTQATTGEGRYQLHELLRQYAEEQLAKSP